MSTTLAEARNVLLKLSEQFPVPSTYATQLAILSDYFDNQVPLIIENRNLLQRIQVLEASIAGVRGALPVAEQKPKIETKPTTRKPIDCTKWIGIGCCTCRACMATTHA